MGVVGRFHWYIGHVMTTVGRALGMDICSGNWYEKGKLKSPYVTIWSGANGPLVAREVKTPWISDLEDMMRDKEYI